MAIDNSDRKNLILLVVANVLVAGILTVQIWELLKYLSPQGTLLW